MRKFLIVFCLLVSVLYLGRHVLVEKTLEIVLEHKTGAKLVYQSCSWEKEKLIYQEFTLGDFLHLPQVEIRWSWQWNPFLIQSHVHLAVQNHPLPFEGTASADLDLTFKAADLHTIRGTIALSDVHWESEDLILDIDMLNSQIDFEGEIATLSLDVQWEGADLFWKEFEILRSQGSLFFQPGEAPIFEAHAALNMKQFEGHTDVKGKGELQPDGTLCLHWAASYASVNNQVTLPSIEGSGIWNHQTLEQLTLQIKDAHGFYGGLPLSDIQATVQLQGPLASFQAQIHLEGPLGNLDALVQRTPDHLQVDGTLSHLEDTVQFQAEGNPFSENWKGKFQGSELLGGTLDLQGAFTQSSLENLSGQFHHIPFTSKQILFQDGRWSFDATLLSLSLEGELSFLEQGYCVTLREIDRPGNLTLQCTQKEDHTHYELQGAHLTPFETVKATFSQQGSNWTLHQGIIDNLRMQGAATQINDQWIISRWDIAGQKFNSHISGLYEKGKFGFQVEAEISSRFSLAGEGIFDLFDPRIQDLSLNIQENGEALATLQCKELQYQEGKWTSSAAMTTLPSWGVQTPLHLSITPQTLTFQGPFSQGALTLGNWAIQLKEIYGLYENSLLNLKCLATHDDNPLQLTGKFTLDPSFEGAVQFYHGIPESHLQFQGQLQKLPSGWTFQGHLKGHEFSFQNYLLQDIDAKVDYTPTEFRLKQITLRDPAGTCTIRKCYGVRSTPQDPWQLSIPLLKAQDIKFSALRKKGAPLQDPKPLLIRNLILADLTGELGNFDSFQGHGSFNFSQHLKKDPTLFDIPLNFLKDLGLDLDLCTPVTGEVDLQLKRGKFFLTDLQNVFSEESRSTFFLAPDTPSFIDLNGNLSLHFRLLQNAPLKLIEPFTITVEGSWEKPRYFLR